METLLTVIVHVILEQLIQDETHLHDKSSVLPMLMILITTRKNH
jgi:hypothetical protein